MKTVMKKMFSLLLVAVLLVGVMPFQAFATSGAEGQKKDFILVAETPENNGWIEGTNYISVTLDAEGNVPSDKLTQLKAEASTRGIVGWTYAGHGQDSGSKVSELDLSAEQVNVYPVFKKSAPEPEPEPEHNTHTPGDAATCTTAQKCTGCEHVFEAAKGHAPGAAATCTANQVCTREGCGEILVNALGHAWVDATCTAAKTCSRCKTTEGAALGHDNVNGKCSRCGYCHECGKVECECITVIFDVSGSPLSNKTFNTIKGVPGETVALPDQGTVDGYSIYGWRINGQIVAGRYTFSNDDAGRTYTATVSYEKLSSSSEKYPLKVYARLKLGDTVRDVREIYSYNGMLETSKILDHLKSADVQATLYNTIEKQYSAYKWSGNFYNAYDTDAATNNITTVDGAKAVYINLKAEEDLVQVYVHLNSYDKSYDRIVEMHGYRHNSVKSTVTSSEVRDALKKYYGSNITIKMFSEQGFDDYIDGKSNTQSEYVTVEDGRTEIHVRLYNASSSSSSSKADSSNPKTGDMIFNTFVIMTASAGALATLFYLNKKRAI